MADVVFKIVAVLMLAVGIMTTVLMWLAAAMGAATNYAKAERTMRKIWIPIVVMFIGLLLCVEAF